VSEPAAIAALFEECDEEHDHTAHKEIADLSDVAKLDTIVTVVDSAHFFQNLGPKSENIQAPRLLMDQVEYSNVVLLNKTDLVSDEQLSKVREHVIALNSKAKIICCKESSIDVSEVVNTGLFKKEDFNLEDFTTMFEGVKPKSCCKASIAKGESPCCLRARTIDSGLSKVLLPSTKNNKTRHGDEYQITSFVYKARRPFHPTKVNAKFIDTYFVVIEEEEEEEEEENSEAEETVEEKESGAIGDIEKLQEEGAKKMALRSEAFGNLLRMKGFWWNASSHDLVGFISAASNVARLESPGKWTCLDAKAYTGTDAEKTKLRKNWAGDWGDRRQELVFIGQGLKHKEIQQLLDSCLLSDDEMAMGVDGWKATFGDVFWNE
jgi:G3E family GTPase